MRVALTELDGVARSDSMVCSCGIVYLTECGSALISRRDRHGVVVEMDAKPADGPDHVQPAEIYPFAEFQLCNRLYSAAFTAANRATHEPHPPRHARRDRLQPPLAVPVCDTYTTPISILSCTALLAHHETTTAATAHRPGCAGVAHLAASSTVAMQVKASIPREPRYHCKNQN